MRFALLCNFLGAILLFLSFQATSSDFRLITASNGDAALCANGRALLIQKEKGYALGIGQMCPEWEHARPAAIVNLELPWLANLGFILTLIGFVLQYFAFPGPRSIAEMRQELKIAKKQQGLKSK